MYNDRNRLSHGILYDDTLLTLLLGVLTEQSVLEFARVVNLNDPDSLSPRKGRLADPRIGLDAVKNGILLMLLYRRNLSSHSQWIVNEFPVRGSGSV
jgi:hypothetical protein